MRIPGAVLMAIVALLAACDTGDGTTLRDPAPDAAPVADVPIGTIDPSPADEIISEGADDTLASVPIESELPAVPDPDAPTLPAPAATGSFTLVTPWPDGTEIDVRHGCDGLNAAPPLAWNGVPDGTAELAVVLTNESDLSRGQPFIHWVVVGIDPSLPGLIENDVPAGSQLALNFFGNVAYDGPCPALGTTDVYSLTVFALNQQLEVAEATPAAEVLDAIRSVAFDQATITGSSTR